MGVRGAGVLIGADKTHFWKGCVPEVEGGGNCRCACGLPITLRNTPGSQRRPTLRQLCPHSTSGLWPLQGCGFVATAGVRLPFSGSWCCRWETCLHGNPPLPSTLPPIRGLKCTSRHHRKTTVYLLFVRSSQHWDNTTTFLALLQP